MPWVVLVWLLSCSISCAYHYMCISVFGFSKLLLLVLLHCHCWNLLCWHHMFNLTLFIVFYCSWMCILCKTRCTFSLLSYPGSHDCIQNTKAALGKLHPEVASTLNKIGNMYYENWDFDAAIKVYEEGFVVERALLQSAHQNIYMHQKVCLFHLPWKMCSFSRVDTSLHLSSDRCSVIYKYDVQCIIYSSVL